jgi:hypothetical protein
MGIVMREWITWARGEARGPGKVGGRVLKTRKRGGRMLETRY